ncbi:MAG TPA: hypothetical protein EYN79_05620 [Planctomycetes bacterium]|nr:hypothetical protein [Planctomycetota bacterium]
MRVKKRRRDILLGYEMNAHPAASLEEFEDALDRYVEPVRKKLAVTGEMAIAPNIGEGLARDLARTTARENLRDRLADGGYRIYTVNAFPLRNFHARRVKEQVYLPSWAHRRRATLTCKIADIVAEVQPDAQRITISTLGGGYRRAGDDRKTRLKMAANYLEVVAHLVRLEARTGILIELTAEPEPDTTFERSQDVIGFFEDLMLPLTGALARKLRVPKARAEELLRRHFTVNLDVCHASVLFCDPVSEWKELEGAGLRVAKLHLTSALSLKNPARNPGGVEELLAFAEGRYLHQSAGLRADGTLWRGRDLPALRRAPLSGLREVRTHFHVPLSRARLGRLPTTREDTSAAIGHYLRHRDPPQLAIETYTWPILVAKRGLGAAERQRHLISGIAAEFRWVLAQLG